MRHFLSKCISNQHKNGGDSRAGRALDLHLSIFYLLIAGLLEGLHTIDGFTREA